MIIVAIDEISFIKASEILNNLNPKKCMVKIGSISFNSIGQEIIYYAAEKGFDIFLDLNLRARVVLVDRCQFAGHLRIGDALLLKDRRGLALVD